MILLSQYFGNKPYNHVDEANAQDLLCRREALRREFRAATGRHKLDIDPDTGTEISGTRGGKGDGGFRLPGTSSGAERSAHKEARAVDDSDQDDAFDNWLTTFDRDNGYRNAMLEKYGLYREHPAFTRTWCHLTTRAPGSGRRTYYPYYP